MSRVSSVALLRVLSLGVAAASTAGLFIAAPLGASTASADIVASDSAVTVAWQGGTSDLEKSQPERNPDSPHFADFENLSVTVSQTTELTDQAIKVDFTGMKPTRSGTSSGIDVANAMNFMQFMQCWGDPTSATFRNTCEWGGFGVTPVAGLESSIPAENEIRGARTADAPPSAEFPDGGAPDVTFTSAQGRSFPGVASLDENQRVVWPLGEMFDGSTTNEVIVSRTGTSGSGTTNFEAQSANRAPQLGCGATNATCYLVAVPRGSHFGGESGTGQCTQNTVPGTEPLTYGRPDTAQEGSPLNPKCDYWDNRIVIPLTFQPVGNNCPAGSAERLTIGSQLLIGAMSSWQPAVCKVSNNVYNFGTNPDSVARAQLLTGRAGLAFTSLSLEDDTLSALDSTKLTKSDITYAPVAVSGLTVAFFIEDNNGRRTELNLSPRILAKLLTESYRFQNPLSFVGGSKIYNLPDVVSDGKSSAPYQFFTRDPDFEALNPDFKDLPGTNPMFVIPGPAGADAIKQLWKWIVADDDARAWLSGSPDEYGMRINPYYLPIGDSAARVPVVSDVDGSPVLDDDGNMTYRPVGLSNSDGSPIRLSTDVRDFITKADQTLAPPALGVGQKYRFTSLDSAPYADTLLSSARAAFRTNANAKIIWNENEYNAAGEKGVYKSAGPQLPGEKFALAITDTASAEKYGLSTASLSTPNSDVFVPPTTETMSGALVGLQATKNPQILQVEPSAVPAGAYPLTTTTYAAVNLSATDEIARKAYAALVTFAITDGQVPGTKPGSLPLGYVPLPRELVQASMVSVQTMLGYVAPTSTPDSPSIGVPPPVASGVAPSAPLQAAAVAAAAPGASTPSIASIPTATATATASIDTPWAYQGALGVSLIVGLAGAAFAPVLMRPRRQNG
ncbi:hypothetical protein [Agreia sp. Leaf283]|uniref:hypothetical protein n=1 Tax=Agreia sp. Leaf283 TaxID=1736321 RepID=UPI0006FCFC9B|nr:hypothetical protein [Agreia sp. Leaf283]KQP56495.1 hypothetical protein ASF51_00745 [Agreia sp. Leaf283]